VPTSEPTNVGQQYGNVVIAPLQKTALNDTGLFGIAPPAAGDVSTSTPAEQKRRRHAHRLDVDSCELTFLIVTPPTHGTLGSIANSACTPGLPDSDAATVTYTPAAGYVGSDSFTYTVSDGLLTSLPATVTIDVRNQRPIADHVSASTNHDTPVEVVLQAADEEECDVTFAIVDPPAHGMLSSVSDDACEPGEPLNFDTARVTYTPDPGFAGDDVFTYEVNDGFQDSTPPARATVTVVPAATAPGSGGGLDHGEPGSCDERAAQRVRRGAVRAHVHDRHAAERRHAGRDSRTRRARPARRTAITRPCRTPPTPISPAPIRSRTSERRPIRLGARDRDDHGRRAAAVQPGDRWPIAGDWQAAVRTA
jgi:hypothetical protein